MQYKLLGKVTKSERPKNGSKRKIVTLNRGDIIELSVEEAASPLYLNKVVPLLTGSVNTEEGTATKKKAKEEAKEITGKAKQEASELVSKAKQEAKDIINEAKQKASEIYGLEDGQSGN